MTMLDCQQQRQQQQLLGSADAHALQVGLQVTTRRRHWHATHSSNVYQLAWADAATAAVAAGDAELAIDVVHDDLCNITDYFVINSFTLF